MKALATGMITLIGNPASRRVQGFAAAAAGYGQTVQLVSYVDLIRDRCAVPGHGVVRLDSPGECAETYRLILRAGSEPLRAAGGVPIGQQEIERLPFERGAVLHPRQWFYGFRQILQRLEARWGSANIRWVSTPSAVVTAFDKLACLQRWRDAGLPTPRGCSQIWSYQQLRETIRTRHARLFLKLRYGYSAIGAVALEWRDSLVRAITTVEVSTASGRPRLYVSKRPIVLRSEREIEWLIDTLAAEEILVEQWLPKARWKGRPFDVRVVMIGGKATHAVGRANASPFTNLNLDATRISRDELIGQMAGHWPQVETLCGAAARQLPGAGVLGIDVLVRPGGKQFALLEANAFGDYLPGLQHRGLSTWDAQMRWLCGAPEAVS